LTSPVYYSTGTTYCVPPRQQIDTGDTMETSFRIDAQQKGFKGALLYKLQRKHAIKIDNQLNSSTEPINNTATNVHLLIVWNVRDHRHNFFVYLIELTDDITWDEDKLWGLYKEYKNHFCTGDTSNSIEWLTHDGIVMRTQFNVTYGSDYKLNIIISEGTRKYKMKEPMKLDPKRLVLLLLMLIVLIYSVRFRIRPSFKLNIHNRCLNVDLVSPTYITGDKSKCHRPPDHKVCAGNTASSGFIIKLGYESYGILIYKLQRKHLHESAKINENTSGAAYILVIWSTSVYKWIFTDMLLVKYDKLFDKNNLREIYNKNIDQFTLHSGPIMDIWLLDDNRALQTIFKLESKGRLLDITVSEVKKYNYVRELAYIDPEK
jgi:hypothetical protein